AVHAVASLAQLRCRHPARQRCTDGRGFSSVRLSEGGLPARHMREKSMNDVSKTPRRATWKWLIAAAAVAVVLLFTVVLPAEYGYDPTRIGRALGLTAIQGSAQQDEQDLDTAIEDLLSANDDLDPAAA